MPRKKEEKKMQTGICPMCDTEFTAPMSNPAKIYCSKKCLRRAAGIRRRQRRGVQQELVCPNCKEKFIRHNSQQLFCSKQCGVDFRRVQKFDAEQAAGKKTRESKKSAE